MRLSRWQVEVLAFEVAKDLVRSGAVDADIDKLAQTVGHVVTADLKVEDDLDAEVREMVRGLGAAMRQQNADPVIMFEKIKKQLVRDRKLVL